MGRDIFQATEAEIGEDGTEWITIIKEGVSQNNRNYRKEALKRAVENQVYNGARMFVDHTDGPPLKRSVKELVSGIDKTIYVEGSEFEDGKARVRGQITWFDDEFKEFSHRASKHLGVSHDSVLKGTRSLKNGRKYEDISDIKKNNSVDWVVYPSAGGGFEFAVKEGVEMEKAIDWDAIDEEMLKEHKPDLYKKLIATRSQESEDDDEDEEDEEEEEEDAQESVKTSKKSKAPKIDTKSLERSIEKMVTRAVESVVSKQDKKSTAQSQIKSYIGKSTLPQLTKDRLVRQFSDSEEFEEDSVKEAIEDAKKEVAAIAGPRVRGMGVTGTAAGSTRSTDIGRAHESVSAVFGGFDPLNPESDKEDKKKQEAKKN